MGSTTCANSTSLSPTSEGAVADEILLCRFTASHVSSPSIVVTIVGTSAGGHMPYRVILSFVSFISPGATAGAEAGGVSSYSVAVISDNSRSPVRISGGTGEDPSCRGAPGL